MFQINIAKEFNTHLKITMLLNLIIQVKIITKVITVIIKLHNSSHKTLSMFKLTKVVNTQTIAKNIAVRFLIKANKI